MTESPNVSWRSWFVQPSWLSLRIEVFQISANPKRVKPAFSMILSEVRVFD